MCIQATGEVDAAARVALEAAKKEEAKEYEEAIRLHGEAAELYALAGKSLDASNSEGH